MIIYCTSMCHAGKWPKDLAAYHKTKAAMGAQLAEELTGSYGLHAAPCEHCIDVFVQGIAFRIYLHSVRPVPALAAGSENVQALKIVPFC